MTKEEELKQEANKYAKGITEKYVFMEHGRASALGYLAGAEPREKRIAELEAQIEKMKSCVNCRYCINEKCPWQPKGCKMKHWELRR